MDIQWTSWESLGKPTEADIARPFVQRNLDGRLELSVLGLGGIFNIFQLSPNGRWNESWRSKDRPAPNIRIRSHVVGRNADGRQEIFAVGDDGAIWQKWQLAPNSGWSDWKSLGTPTRETALTERLVAGRNQDGRQELFAIGTDGNVWQIWQTVPGGGWSEWRRLGKPPREIRPSDRITTTSNKDGRQELFVIGADDALWHIRQVGANGGWSDWESLGKPRDLAFPEPKDRDLSNPVVRRNDDGHLEVFSPGNGAFCNRWQEAPNGTVWRHEGWNAKPKPQPEVGITWLDAALNVGGQLARHIEAFALADDGALWHAWQIDQAPNWSHWHSLGKPAAGIRAADRLAIGTHQDGRLEVFVVGQDGAAWRISQRR
ncbi:MAG: hypothetical protein ABJA98_06465 [Acidobacteriota bacterium]